MTDLDDDTINQGDNGESDDDESVAEDEPGGRLDNDEQDKQVEQAEQRAILDDPQHMRQVELAKLELYMQKQTGVLRRIAKDLAARHKEMAVEYESGNMAHMSEDAANLRTAAVELASAAGKFLA